MALKLAQHNGWTYYIYPIDPVGWFVVDASTSGFSQFLYFQVKHIRVVEKNTCENQVSMTAGEIRQPRSPASISISNPLSRTKAKAGSRGIEKNSRGTSKHRRLPERWNGEASHHAVKLIQVCFMQYISAPLCPTWVLPQLRLSRCIGEAIVRFHVRHDIKRETNKKHNRCATFCPAVVGARCLT